MSRIAKEIIVLLVVYMSMEAYTRSVGDWTEYQDCVQACTCKWIEGKKAAKCINVSFTDVPLRLSNELQTLILDNSAIDVVRSNTFKQAGLINLQKVSMRYCRIREIEKNAFAGLAIVSEIDLTGNNIRRLEPSLFVPTEKLRIVYLNNNLIEKLEDGCFANLKSLQTINLENNRISHIENKAFENIPLLKDVNLSGNQLSSIEIKIFEKFGNSLKNITLNDNPWRCDCHLRDFSVWYNKINDLNKNPVTCFEPEFLANTSWNRIELDKFACKPEILWLSLDTVFEANSDQLKLACKVTGDPKPEVNWTSDGKPLGNITTSELLVDNKYTNLRSEENAFWVNATITKANLRNQGTFTCTAKSHAGTLERNVTVSA